MPLALPRTSPIGGGVHHRAQAPAGSASPAPPTPARLHAASRRNDLLQRRCTPPLGEAQLARELNETSTSGRQEARLDGASPDELLDLLRQKQQGGDTGVGAVYLVGTGPGDPGLLTLRALQLMQTADVVLYDRLVSPDILRLVHGGARMVYVGKQAGFHTRSQGEIHELLRSFAERGARVLRLKGGDPFVFGRGGEEQQYLEARGVRTYVVPGITAASGIAAELGIPLTHRGLATSVRFLTGHSREGAEEEVTDTLAACRDPHTTLVVYMGLGTLPALAAQLQQAGLPADTPAVAVERGTTPEQRVVYGTLASLHAEVTAAALVSPTLVVIGRVVALSPGWAAYEAEGRALQQPGVWGGLGGGALDAAALARAVAVADRSGQQAGAAAA